MNLKLFIVMGVSWFLEVCQTFLGNTHFIWYIVDTFNILQGVLVFFIFVFKKKVFYEMKYKFGKFIFQL